MKYEVYSEIKITDDFGIFDFMSIGKKGYIPKGSSLLLLKFRILLICIWGYDENNE